MARILIVDDEPGVIITLKTMLKVDGHEVVIAENGVSGIECLQIHKGSLDLVITDIQMPEMDGLQFISRLLDITPDLPVIAISGGGNRLSNLDPLASLKDKISGTVRKPFTHDELFQAVNAALDSALNRRSGL
ncbi:MAG: response regulator [Alphaproteobacteria bacterium]|nr:response regulator [Alphaproteobacteria bacterium]MBP7759978.1 response regulator [Alphaproteobacteria bacterium]MBP7763356.1 response regulator [Alphaproteobacteria bacterium]